MILDTSAVLAFAFDEAVSDWVERQISNEVSGALHMSWVNIAEAGMTFRRQRPRTTDVVEPILRQLGVIRLDLDREVVNLAIEARSRFPLNFGDCFAYAHAKLRNEALITLDDDFLKTDLAAVIHPSRG